MLNQEYSCPQYNICTYYSMSKENVDFLGNIHKYKSLYSPWTHCMISIIIFDHCNEEEEGSSRDFELIEYWKVSQQALIHRNPKPNVLQLHVLNFHFNENTLKVRHRSCINICATIWILFFIKWGKILIIDKKCQTHEKGPNFRADFVVT